ncbi:YjjG family noncanonical pyrimidine nucleotidase [Stenotrophomonas sp. C3(2023)]|uniref:YjjG family noncanonical pyrimidine nucleotidase n=1 Tax=Stenotrophomonas sp. C3(2023) TaxID=3080277 RepID=UPI00293E3730|nr:YjjG family noncanonical pyrimidine nucleotidase [Stenotrophomonas sp. C3(2023)]
MLPALPMKYRRFLFDLDDTLLDFRASERLSFERTLQALQIDAPLHDLYARYQLENTALWSQLERGEVSKDALKWQRFARTFAAFGLDADSHQAGEVYLQLLPQTVVLVPGAEALCRQLAAVGELGIITNGIEAVQTRRIAASGLAPWIHFVATSEACGYAKPDVRFFAYASARFSTFSKADTVIVGDRLEADVLGANRFGIDSCWFNPAGLDNPTTVRPTWEVASLHTLASQLK